MNATPSPLVYSGPALFSGVPLADFNPVSASDRALLCDAIKKRRAAIFHELCNMDISRDADCVVSSALRGENGDISVKFYGLTGIML